MARRYFRRRPRFRRRAKAWYDQPITARGVAKTAMKAWSLAKTVAGVVNVEYKILDTVQSPGTSVTTAGVIYPLTLIAQGDDYNNRQGNSVLAKSLQTHMVFSGLTMTAVGIQVRCIWFVDTECAGALPNVTDILEQAIPLSPLYHAQHYRFRILKDKRFLLQHDPITASSGGSNPMGMKELDVYFKLNKLHLKYQNVGGVISACKQNQIHLLVIADNATGTPANFGAYSRLRFIDN